MSLKEEKVLHVITGLDDGGAEAVLYRLCCFERQNTHIVVSLTDRGKYADLFDQAGIDVFCLDMTKGLLSIQGIYKLWKLVNKIEPNIIQTWMYHADLIGGIVGRFSGIQAICWGVHHTDLHPVKTKFTTRLVARVCALVSGWLPAKIICCAHKSREVHLQFGYPINKCVVIPNGYDLARFSPDDNARQRLRDELDLAENMPLFGMIARFDPQKDHENLLKALSILKIQGYAFRCILVGNGLTGDNDELSMLIDHCEVRDRVLLLGARNDVPDIMNSLDVHVLSSAYGEAFPNVLSEAMACGTPCIATDVGDAGVIVGDTGWIVSAQSPQELAAAMIQALTLSKNRADWKERQKRCRERIIENFSIDKTCQAYRKVWQESKMSA